MRGTIAKQIRKFVRSDMPDAPESGYYNVYTSMHSSNTTRFLTADSKKGFYRTLKKVWKEY